MDDLSRNDDLPRNFKGLWIPRELWLDERLTSTDKFILSEIDSLDRGEDHCYASDEHFIKMFKIGKSTLHASLAKLRFLGLIENVSPNGRSRVIKSNLGSAYLKTQTPELMGPDSGMRVPDFRKARFQISGRQAHRSAHRAGDTRLDTIKKEDVCPDPLDGGPVLPNLVKKIRTNGEVLEVNKDDIYRRAIAERKEWKTTEIESAWKILVEYRGAIYDPYAFIAGTIKKQRIKKQFSKMEKRICQAKQDPGGEVIMTSQASPTVIPELHWEMADYVRTSRQLWLNGS